VNAHVTLEAPMDAAAQEITLVRLDRRHREAFVREELANYAEEQIRDAGWLRSEALDRARAELLPALERELDDAGEQGHDLWPAVRADGVAVGWLWVRPDGERSGSAFLYQITVAGSLRRMGYGRAMLAALEERLLGDGIDELRLNVNVGNLPARRLYAALGYERVDEDGRVCRLRKRLATPVPGD
jgi:ribosomal protein S18 acetylase RimI-like enzyme